MSEVKTGQRFRDVHRTMFGRTVPDLLVHRVFRGTDGYEYAQLRSTTNTSDLRTLSTMILRDRSRFIEVPVEARKG